MNVKKEVTMTWKEAPDTIDPIIYSQITGLGENTCRDIFKRPDFPRIEGTGNKQLADKRAAMLYNMGFKVKTNKKESIEYLMLLELQKLNQNMKVGVLNETSN